MHDKKEYIINNRNLKQALNDGLVLEKLHRIIKFNRKAWLKPYIDMNIGLRKKAKYGFEKSFLKLMNNTVLRKAIGNVRKHRDIKLATNKSRMYYLVS